MTHSDERYCVLGELLYLKSMPYSGSLEGLPMSRIYTKRRMDADATVESMCDWEGGPDLLQISGCSENVLMLCCREDKGKPDLGR